MGFGNRVISGSEIIGRSLLHTNRIMNTLPKEIEPKYVHGTDDSEISARQDSAHSKFAKAGPLIFEHD